MTDGPFRISTTPVGNPCVVAMNGDVVHVCLTPHNAQHALGESLRIWHYAGGPRLLAERDEAIARATAAESRVRELEEALWWYASEEPYSVTCATDGWGTPTEVPHLVIEEDRGARARTALGGTKA